MTTKALKQIIFLIVLLIAFAIIQLFIKNNILAVCLLGVMVVGIFIYLRRSNTTSKRQKDKIIRQGKRVRARILSVKDYQRTSIILSLQIEHPEKFYVTSYVITNADSEERDKYKPDQQLNVFVNPDNQYEVYIPETKKVNEPTRSKGGAWVTVFIVLVSVCSFGIPFIVDFFDYSDRVFKDVAFVSGGEDKGNIWEVRFQAPKSIFIKIYDPLSGEKIKSIKDKKDEELESYTDFFISQQGQKVYIVGTGNTPVIDVYDADTYNKIAGIKDFEKTNSLLGNGITTVQKRSSYYSFNKDDVIDITTNDGNKCFYDIQKDKFFDTENDIREYIEDADYAVVAKQMFTYVLSNIPNSANKHQLYLVAAKSKKVLQTLRGFVGSNSFDVNYFNENKKYYFKDFTLAPLCEETYFLEGKFIYFDALLAIIQHVDAINKDAKELISGIEKSGKTLFSIKEADYPNIDDMKENSYAPRSNQELKTIRSNDKIVFLFDKYGALCVDINTGKIIWKYEP
jgi:hypothetical protein